MIYLFLSLIIGISAAIFVWAIFVIEKDLSPNTLRRLERIKNKSNVTMDNDSNNNLTMVMTDTDYQIKAFGEVIKKFEFANKIKELIILSDLKIQVDVFILFSFACALPFLIFLVTPFKLMSLIGIGAICIPTLYLKNVINKRFLDFSKQFPDALNLMASSLRAGHPLFSAIDIVTEEMPKPICDVFGSAKKDISLGMDSKEAFFRMSRIMPKSMDLRFFITAVLIQKEVGGNLAELLNKLSETIRERFKLMAQLRVQTSQTRLSGTILGIVPVAVLILISFMNPEYMKPMFETKDGQIAFAVAIVLIIAGFISIKKFSDIEI